MLVGATGTFSGVPLGVGANEDDGAALPLELGRALGTALGTLLGNCCVLLLVGCTDGALDGTLEGEVVF